MFIEIDHLRVGVSNKQHNLDDPAATEPFLTCRHYLSAYALQLTVWRCSHVIEPAAMAIMASHDAADYPSFGVDAD